jgi:hypothetical protein
MQFWFKTATQQDTELLKFLHNGSEIRSWSGENDWNRFYIPVSAGTHNFAWVFENNEAEIDTNGKVWIDNIGFPPIIGHILYPVRDLEVSIVNDYYFLYWIEPFITSMIEPDPPVLLGYNVFQDSEMLNSDLVSDTSFTIINVGVVLFVIIAGSFKGKQAALQFLCQLKHDSLLSLWLQTR